MKLAYCRSCGAPMIWTVTAGKRARMPVDAVLRAVAHYPEGCSRQQLTALTGYRRSTRDRYLQYLGQKGLVAMNGARATVTAAGEAALGDDFEPLPIGSALLQHWRARLPDGQRQILDVVVAVYPNAIDREAVTEGSGLARSTRDRYLQYLQAAQLVKPEGRGAVRASDMLFDGVA